MRYVAIALVLLGICVAPAEARRYRTPVSAAPIPIEINRDLQHIAPQRADKMAERETLDHNIHLYTNAPVWLWAGVSGEGIGCAKGVNSTDVATCIVGSVVIADAHAIGASGTIYRVRLFR